MANICSNTLAFYSADEKIVREFKRFIENSIERNSWIGNIAIALGFPKDLPFDSRGWIDEVTDIEKNDKDRFSIYAFKVWSETKWSPMTEFWENILEKYNEKNNLTEDCIYYDFIADEPGCEIYINTDTDGIFFEDRVVIEICHKGDYLDPIYLNRDDNETIINAVLEYCEAEIPDNEKKRAYQEDDGYEYLCNYIEDNTEYEIFIHFYEELMY